MTRSDYITLAVFFAAYYLLLAYLHRIGFLDAL